MKGFELKVIGNEEQVVLDSKIAVCECKNCAARIEKRMYFTGVCPYCDSSDLYAKVLSGNRFYSIENQISKGTNKPDFYAAKNIGLKKGLMAGYFGLAMFVIIIFFIMGIDQMSKYNDEEYLIEVLFSEEDREEEKDYPEFGKSFLDILAEDETKKNKENDLIGAKDYQTLLEQKRKNKEVSKIWINYILLLADLVLWLQRQM